MILLISIAVPVAIIAIAALPEWMRYRQQRATNRRKLQEFRELIEAAKREQSR